jgi:hypothetical protein
MKCPEAGQAFNYPTFLVSCSLRSAFTLRFKRIKHLPKLKILTSTTGCIRNNR